MYTTTFQAYKNSNICRPEMHLSTKISTFQKEIINKFLDIVKEQGDANNMILICSLTMKPFPQLHPQDVN